MDVDTDPKTETLADDGADEDALLAEDAEMTTEGAEGGAGEDADNNGDAAEGGSAKADTSKTEEELEKELKETQITIPRYAPHSNPEWQLDAMRSRWQWHIRIFPIDQEDCRNCILDTATKISQEAWYYVPKRKIGQGIAELCMTSTSEAKSVMGRVARMPFYHRFVTIEINKRRKDEKSSEKEDSGSYTEIEESAVIVFDSTKCETIKNTASSKGGLKRRTLWVRYLSEDTTPELLRVVFPFAQTTQVQTHDNLRIGEVMTNAKTDVLLFMKSYLTVSMNGTHILALQNNEPTEKESDLKAELEKSVTAFTALEEAPTTVADRSYQKKEDRNATPRVLKRSLQPQMRQVDSKRKVPLMRDRKGHSGEPPAKRGGRGNWGDRFEGRRSGGGGRFGGGYPSGPGSMGGYGGGGPGPSPHGYGGMLDPQGMAAEMIMMQAQLNQTIQNQLRMLNPSSGGGRMGGGGGGGGGGRGEGRRGGWGSGGRGGGRGGGRKGYGGRGW